MAKSRPARAGAPAQGPKPKRTTRPTTQPATGTAQQRRQSQLQRFNEVVEGAFDAVALVEIFRFHMEDGTAPPRAAVEALESLLTDVVDLAKSRHAGRWIKYLRAWPQRFLDSAIADHLICTKAGHHLTWNEAGDEAADWFQRTKASGGRDKMLAAYKRDKKRGIKRAWTTWERAQAGFAGLTSRPARPNSWWALNQDRMGNHRAEWRARPRPSGRI